MLARRKTGREGRKTHRLAPNGPETEDRLLIRSHFGRVRLDAADREERIMYDTRASYGTEAPLTAQQVRAERLVRAEHDRTAASREADVEYLETVTKLRERFEADLADALSRRLAAVRPVHQAYNLATVRAEREFLYG
jgi:hypothetical protein